VSFGEGYVTSVVPQVEFEKMALKALNSQFLAQGCNSYMVENCPWRRSTVLQSALRNHPMALPAI